MKAIFKAVIGVMGFGLVAACMPYDGYGGSYYGSGYGAGYDDWGYCDGFGCPDNYWDQPLYYGSVYYGGRWNSGPFYYRNYNGGRQYWLGGGWRNDDWRGARPQQYRNERYGPALGRDWYRNNRPNDGRPGFNQGGGQGRGGDRPGFNQGRGGDRPGVNQGTGQGRGGDRDDNRGPRGGGPGGGRGPDNVQQNNQSYPDRGGRAQGMRPDAPRAQTPQGPRGGGDGGGNGPRPGGRARGLPQQ